MFLGFAQLSSIFLWLSHRKDWKEIQACILSTSLFKSDSEFGQDQFLLLLVTVRHPAHPGLELRRSMEEARDAWSLLEEHVLLLGTPREVEGTPGCAVPPPRVWCEWRDLGRLAKRPSAIILNSAKKHTEKQTETTWMWHFNSTPKLLISKTHFWMCSVHSGHLYFIGWVPPGVL